MVLQQPRDVVFVDVGGTARLPCVSNRTLETGGTVSWYRRTWRVGEAPERVVSCSNQSERHKCKLASDRHRTDLEIHNVQRKDSGVYYCAAEYGNMIFANGTTLIVGDSSTSNSSVHLLGPSRATFSKKSVQLACVAQGAQHMVHMAWNISGTKPSGRIIAMEDIGGTWTFLNYITVPMYKWKQEENLVCSVWFNSTPIHVLKKITEEAVAVQMALYPVEEVVFAKVNGAARISCSFDSEFDSITRIMWFRKTFALGEAPKTVVTCAGNNNTHKYLCGSDANRTTLTIFNGQINDSGIYYCASYESMAGKGTRVIVGDASTSNTTVHLLAPYKVPLDSQPIHLTCMVRTLHQIVRLIWNISGNHHEGKVIAMEHPAGTWNFINPITVDRTQWDNGKLTCEVHFNSSVISAHLNIVSKESTTFGHRCAASLIPVLIGILLLLTILSGHLLWIFKQPGQKKTERETSVSDTQDGIVYAELNRGSLNPHRTE
ncbi:uncharacterized protein LOC116406845 [Xenopus tropicalis]|uniref:Uncharacterized protein LOC116406845 n=1 Tax=Xenopus tropicalis TaxID=8364 RepID=A0A8J1ISE6_XENTR|nr:uncharacterized protein LOC116406845 [Xenopus tropicalis]